MALSALLLLPGSGGGWPQGYAIHARRWCENSLRLTLTLTSLPPSVAASRAVLARRLSDEALRELPGALIRDECEVGEAVELTSASPISHGNLRLSLTPAGLHLSSVEDNRTYFTALPSLSLPYSSSSYLKASLRMMAGDTSERIYGLGQGNWTKDGSCPSGDQYIVPLERNGQIVNLR